MDGWILTLFIIAAFAGGVVISVSMGITGAFTSETLKLYALGFPFMLAGLWTLIVPAVFVQRS
jgi:hypothetical protein